jgi:hypothetical protein
MALWASAICSMHPASLPFFISAFEMSRCAVAAFLAAASVGACQWARAQHRRGTRHRAAEAEGAGLWFRHGQRAAQGRQASDRGALLSEQPRRHDTRGQDLRSARQL